MPSKPRQQNRQSTSSLWTARAKPGECNPSHPIAPPHSREVGHPRARRRENEAIPVPQPRAGPLLLAGVQPVQVHTVGEIENVGVAGVDDGGARLEYLPVDLNVLRCEERTRQVRSPQGVRSSSKPDRAPEWWRLRGTRHNTVSSSLEDSWNTFGPKTAGFNAQGHLKTRRKSRRNQTHLRDLARNS